MVSNNKTGCRFITVDAYFSAVEFYTSNGFEFMGSEEKNRYLQEKKRSLEDKEHFKKEEVGTFAMMFDLKNVIQGNPQN